jgi:hypothetical protein
MERSGGFIPNPITAGTVSVVHYLKAVQAADTDDGWAVAAEMREILVTISITRTSFARGAHSLDGLRICLILLR